MFVTRMSVFIGIMCAAWMTSPLTANAFDKFVGLSDRGSTKVTDCGVGGGRAVFVNTDDLDIEFNMEFSGNDGLIYSGDSPDVNTFLAQFTYYDVPPPTPTQLLSGVWSKVGERLNHNQTPRIETYQLTPSGDLAELSPPSGWHDMLTFIGDEAGEACLVPPLLLSPLFPDFEEFVPGLLVPISDFVRGTLVVNHKKPITCDDDDLPCSVDCAGGFCRAAKVRLNVRAFVDFTGTGEVSSKRDLVDFKYKAKGYVVVIP
jgi:hypothetical protein